MADCEKLNEIETRSHSQETEHFLFPLVSLLFAWLKLMYHYVFGAHINYKSGMVLICVMEKTNYLKLFSLK